jgi:poly(A) polymerase
MVMSVEPIVIPRKEHRISRKQISPNAVKTLYRLHYHGFVAHLVGGCVRDLLLGRSPKDFDIATNATPGQIKRLFRNCRLIGRRFRLAHLHFQDEILEVSTFRRTALPSDEEEPSEDAPPRKYPRHVKDEEGMVLVDNLFGTPEEDALRRDFTINALAYSIGDFSVIDYTGGIADLEQRLIRLIGDPQIRFTEDPVRMLRAVRFAASHGFTIEPAAWETLCELAPTITRASPARLYEEIQKIFLLGAARAAFDLLERSGLIMALFPDLARWVYGNSSRFPALRANLDAVDRLHREGTPASVALFMAALFGPSVEEAALSRHKEGIPRQQALDEACASLMQEICPVVSIPGRVTNKLRNILALQSALTRTPPRRPQSTLARPEFSEAVSYLRISAETRRELEKSVDWWVDYASNAPTPEATDSETEEPAPKKRRRRRYRKRKPKEQAE